MSNKTLCTSHSFRDNTTDVTERDKTVNPFHPQEVKL